MKRVLSTLLALCLGLAALQYAQAQATGQRLRGDVLALQGATLQLRSTGGEVLVIRLAESARITLESRVDLSAVVPGVYVGTTSEPQADGTLRAVQIRIFPEALRGIGEGHRPMGPQGANTMTNATVAQLGSGNTMTNATVASVGGVNSAPTMTLNYKGEEKRIVVPPDVAVIRAELGSPAALTAGAHIVVLVTQQPDGALVSDRVTVGKDGSTPM